MADVFFKLRMSDNEGNGYTGFWDSLCIPTLCYKNVYRHLGNLGQDIWIFGTIWQYFKVLSWNMWTHIT